MRLNLKKKKEKKEEGLIMKRLVITIHLFIISQINYIIYFF